VFVVIIGRRTLGKVVGKMLSEVKGKLEELFQRIEELRVSL
jgi:hypothetical protein